MYKLDYNLFEAIELRGKTIEQANLGEVMHPSVRQKVIDFTMSLNCTKGNQNWPDPPLVYEVLGNGEAVQQRAISREVWKAAYGSYRKYMRQMYEDVK